MKNLNLFLALPFLAVVLSPVAAQAVDKDGGDIVIENVGGTIRIVLSKPGHLQTEGDVSVDFYQPTNANGVYDTDVNPFNNKPSPYLGGTVDNGSHEFDAGVQFETGVISRPIGIIGFSAFISRGPNTYVNPRLWNGDVNNPQNPGGDRGLGLSVKGGKYHGGMLVSKAAGADLSHGHYDGHLIFKIEPPTATFIGGVCLSVSNFESDSAVTTDNGKAAPAEFFYWNQELDPRVDKKVKAGYELGPDNKPLTDPADPTGKTLLAPHQIAPWGPDKIDKLSSVKGAQANDRVKHESAMTRGNSSDDFKLDGSQTTISWDKCVIDHVGGSYGAWTQGDTDLSYAPIIGKGGYSKSTGYNAPANGKGAACFDRLVQGKVSALSQTIVQYSTDNKTNLALRQSVFNPNRYAGETVLINLKTVTEPQGQPLEWEKP